jgi:hypothetical protein
LTEGYLVDAIKFISMEEITLLSVCHFRTFSISKLTETNFLSPPDLFLIQVNLTAHGLPG